MRRIRASVVLAVIVLVAWPERAEAYFWAWLDDLSGPRYMAVFGSIEVLCTYRDTDASPDAVAWITDDLQKKLKAVPQASGPSAQQPGAWAKLRFDDATTFISKANDILAEVRKRQATDPATRKERANLLAQARLLDGRASVHMQSVARPDKDPTTQLLDQNARALVAQPATVKSYPRRRNGFAPSMCASSPEVRNRFYLTFDAGYGWDAKNRNRDQGHSMIMLGTSAHYAVTPYLSVGSGAGVVRFKTPNGKKEVFYSPYLEPAMLDFRPLALLRASDVRSPLLHVFFLRGSVIVFPRGFDAGTFPGQTDRFNVEWTPSAGVYFDLTPILRNRRGNW